MSSAPQPTAFQDALERAKAIAAKIAQNQPGKRSVEEEEDITPESKRFQPMTDPIGAQLAAMKQQAPAAQSAPSMLQPPGPSVKPNQFYPDGIVVGGEKTLDMMIPGTKVGYVIGKGGEMIRTLQERASVKMTVIQTTAEATEEQKQLRIVGEPSKVDYARQLVDDLLIEKEIEFAKLKNRGRDSNSVNDYGSPRVGSREIQVPPQFIGLVIGKGGENIKRIQAETNTKVQFEISKTDPKGTKVCIIQGQQEAVRRAAELVQEIIDNAASSRGRIRGRPEGDEVRMNVPPNRTGVVIGKGGDTIRAIKQQSGCDIELEKNSKGVFIIRGPPDRVPIAQQLINEKVHGHMQNDPQQSSGYGDPYREKHSHQPHHSSHQAHHHQQQQYWPSNYWQPENSQNSNDSSSQLFQDAGRMHQEQVANTNDTNAAYYAAYYAQYAQYAGAQQIAAGIPASTAPTSNGNSQTGQPQQDYSAQWAEYYRAYGMHKEAEMIEQMAKQMREQSGQQPQQLQQSQQINSQQPPQPGSSSKESGNPSDLGPVSYPGYNYGGGGGGTQDQ
ncbi:far upstream element-binding protein 1-like isoform X2 [Brevipalpus obovatus]|uniref:far upstream element-binding protein 1-like isoform X2 n=1 Tax=Brevipalpus obovatus TaxID=246614 RepID=UPI003D9F2343